MRITRYRDINMGGYFNLETEAHKMWKEENAMRRYVSDYFTPISRGEAYRRTIDGVFSSSVSLGYPIIATADASVMCPECAKKVYLEGPTEYCDECGCAIESAYGDIEDGEE